MARRLQVAVGFTVASFLVPAVVTGCDPGGSHRQAAHRTVPAAAPVHLSSYQGGSVVTAAAATATGNGYWVSTSDGRITPEGDAVAYGDASGLQLAGPVVDVATTPSGGGYWLLGGDGGVFNFGNAGYFGSMGGSHLNGQALQLVGTPSGAGYWFVARDGGVFNFGDAGFFGSTGSMRLNQPVVGMAPTPTGRGYWLVARDGGIFNFGDAVFHGSDGGGALAAPAIGIIATHDGGGYWIVLGNGQVHAFGDATTLATQPLQTTGFSLVGQIVGLDPGHNGGNGSDPGYINQLVWNGRAYETCDTTGTATNAGYTEASFNFDVASRLATLLRSDGATVVMTRTGNTGVGPCVNQRAAIGNAAGSDVMFDIHGDGGPSTGWGFAVLEPVADGPNNAVISPSDRLAVITRDTFRSVTGEPVSTYDGVDGLQPRSDLAGLNLTMVPKVLIECANMRNAGDAANVSNPGWRQTAAAALEQSASRFLIGFP